MNYRRFGRTKWNISEIGYGMWGMGGWTGSEDTESLASLQRAIDLGCNFFDTAWAYGEGHSEELLGKALHYVTAQWPKLERYVEDGRYPIDNNSCENAIRPFVVGRRNWLFADTVAGANASADLYSLLQTCVANKIGGSAS